MRARPPKKARTRWSNPSIIPALLMFAESRAGSAALRTGVRQRVPGRAGAPAGIRRPCS
jgi:hypothetical protein